MAGGSTTRTEPWAEQKPYLEAGFREAGRLYNQGPPSYYQGPTLAGFDPAQQVAQRATLGYALGPRPQALQGAAETSLVRGLSGEVNTDVFNPMISNLGDQMRTNLQMNVLPGIRQNLIQYGQEGGSSRGDLVQANAIAAANQQMLNKASEMYAGAYQGAQGRVPQFQQLYPNIMSAPMGLYGAVGEVGADRRAMAQEAINRKISQSMYEKQAEQQNLQAYMANISGDYGGTVRNTPGPVQQIGQLAGLVSTLSGIL